MNLQKIRTSRNIEQAELARQIGTTAPMMSYFEHYKCLPVPEMLTQICNILKCNISDLYEDKEIYLKTVTNGCSHLKVEDRKEPTIYKLTVRLPETKRNILTQENLQKCGYHSLKDFIWHCVLRFEKQLATTTKKDHQDLKPQGGHEIDT